MTFIAQVCFYYFSIANSKTFSIVSIALFSISFEDDTA